MSLQDVLTIIGYALLFALCGIAFKHRAKIGAFFSRYVVVYRYNEPDDDADFEPESSIATTTQLRNNLIAITQEERNSLLAQGQVLALAALIQASRKKPFKDGKIRETEGITIVFKLQPSGTSKAYRDIRDALTAELEHLDPPKYRTTPEQDALRRELRLQE
jgi:hypothetical protein